MKSTIRTLGVALALTLASSPARAQFTAVVEPPKKAPAPAAVAAATPGATRDSAGRTQLSDMRAWVDSAAGVAATPAAPAAVGDTIAAIADSAKGEVVAEPRVKEAGMRAPDTATVLPALALAGLAMLGAGVWLLRRARA